MSEDQNAVVGWSRTQPPTGDLARKALRELDERPEERELKLEALREALDWVNDLKARTDQEFLLRFLRARKYRVEESFKLMISYYRQRITLPHIYRRLQTTDIPEVLKVNLLGMLPHRDREGRAIFVFNSAQLWEPKRLPVEDIILYCLMSLERAVQAQDVQVSGIVCLVDCRGFGLRHLRASSPRQLAQLFAVTQGSFPARFKQIHVINQPKIFSVVFAIIKRLVSEKLRRRFFFHGQNLESLHEHFQPDILPEEFGGRLGPFDNTQWNTELIDNDANLIQDQSYGFIAS